MSRTHDEPVGVYDEDDDHYDIEAEHDEVEVEQAPAPRNRSRQAPRNMSRLPRPQDHRKPKRRQVQREAEGDDDVEIEFRGRTYTIPADQDDWTLDAMEAFERNQMFGGIRALLGPRQWAEFKARHNNRRAFREFLDEVADIFGFETAGN